MRRRVDEHKDDVALHFQRIVANQEKKRALRARTVNKAPACGRIDVSVHFPLVPAPPSLVVYYRKADAKTQAVEVWLPPTLTSPHRGSSV